LIFEAKIVNKRWEGDLYSYLLANLMVPYGLRDFTAFKDSSIKKNAKTWVQFGNKFGTNWEKSI
jgi:N-acetyl-beta-hexosaminidase